MSVYNLLRLSYWFQQPQSARGAVLFFWVAFFLALVLAGLICKYIRHIKEEREIKEVLRRFGNLGLVMGFLGLLWLFFRQERVAFFAWRFWLSFWLLGFVSWLLALIRYAIKRLPEIKREKLEKEMRAKYLPKRK